MASVFKVCIPNTHRDFFDYQATGITPAIGARVLVPFRHQNKIGIVISTGLPEQSERTLKEISSVLDDNPILPLPMLEFYQWISDYYQSPLSEVIAQALPKFFREGKHAASSTEMYFECNLLDEPLIKKQLAKAKRQRELFAFLKNHVQPMSMTQILQAGFKRPQIEGLLKANLIHLTEKTCQTPLAIRPDYDLNAEQQAAVQAMVPFLDTYQCFLLQGITGSGKTEVYLQVIELMLKAQKQVLVIVPEIGLTPQLLARFRQRFQAPMAIVHSNLSDGERFKSWQSARLNEVKLVIGTRSAIFTPMPALGLIVIDEEHDLSLKQMEGVRYSARDAALMRAYLMNIPIVLGTATPSLESLHNCQQQKYIRLLLTQKALNTHPLQYRVIDIREQKLNHGLAQSTLLAIENHLNAGNQVLVFINRRGYAPVLLCHQCGWIADCRACDSHQTLHREIKRLICHHCGLAQTIPAQCPHCHAASFVPIGSGTQRIHEFLASIFPQTNLVRIDRDEVSQKNSFDKKLHDILNGETQLIIGTQMLAKGHHFPRLTLVVVLEADYGLYSPDFRAIERFGQLLTQVAGRAGRADLPGEVLIQTHAPQHPLFNLLLKEGYDALAQCLLTQRQQAQWPPFYYLALIRAQHKNQHNVLQFLHACKEQLLIQPLEIFGPAPAPLAKKAGQHRLQLLIKSPSRQHLRTILTQLRQWLTRNKLTNGLRWNIDVDPMDLA